MKPLCLAAYSFRKGNGGIAQVSRMIARVLTEEAEALGIAPRLLAFEDESPPDGIPFPFSTARGSALRYALLVRRHALSGCDFLYDSCNMAQVHPRLPGLNRRNLIMINGIEVWEDAKDRWLRAARNATMLVSISEHTREKAEKLHGGFSRARVCWLGTDTDQEPEVTSSRPASDAPPRALIVGRMESHEAYKGHRELIDAWPAVLPEVPDAQLHIAGKGSGVEELKTIAENSGAERSIVFHGYVSFDDLEKLYLDCRLYAMPSRGEGFGLVYIDAMRFRRPVIASNRDAGQEVVAHGETGYVVDPEDIEGLVESVVRLMKDPELASRLGDKGFQRWKEHFTYSAFKRRFLPLLEHFVTAW